MLERALSGLVNTMSWKVLVGFSPNLCQLCIMGQEMNALNVGVKRFSIQKRLKWKRTCSHLNIKGCGGCCFPAGWPMSRRRHTVSRWSNDSESLQASLPSATHESLAEHSLVASDTRHTAPPTPLSASAVSEQATFTNNNNKFILYYYGR